MTEEAELGVGEEEGEDEEDHGDGRRVPQAEVLKPRLVEVVAEDPRGPVGPPRVRRKTAA